MSDPSDNPLKKHIGEIGLDPPSTFRDLHGCIVRFVALAVGLLAAACGGSGTTAPEESDDYPYPVGRIVLSNLPVDIDRVVNFQGIGNLNVLPEDHGGFFTPQEGWYQEPTVPVYAPADGKIFRVSQRWYPSFAPYGDDFDLFMRVSTTITVGYAHMSALSDEILEAAGPAASGFEGADVDIEVQAGQILGYVGTQGALDWHLKDSAIQPSLLRQDRYPDGWGDAACYHEYYDEPLRGQLLAITERTVEPRCGKIDYDIAGRIIGNWFWEAEVPTPQAFNDYSTHLAIVYGQIEGDRVAISDGIAIRPESPHLGDERYGAARVFWVKNNEPKPETIGVAEGLVKYEIMEAPPLAPIGERPPLDPTIKGVFLVQLIEPGRLKVERVMGKTADEVAGFSIAARIYVR